MDVILESMSNAPTANEIPKKQCDAAFFAASHCFFG